MQPSTSSPPSLSRSRPYTGDMPRTLSKPRPHQGARLLELRKAAGLSQIELAHLIGERQQNIAFWEQSDKPPRADILSRIAEVLAVSVDQLLGTQPAPTRRAAGPVGKVRRAFAAVSKLPRRQQDKIVEIVDAMVEQYNRAAG